MSIINELDKIFRIDGSCNAANESEIDELIKYATLTVPDEYLELIREQTEVEISINDQKYIRIWGADGVIEMNDAYFIQRYIPNSLAIGDDEDGNALLYADGKSGFGLYAVAFNDLDVDEMIFISGTLKELLIAAKGVEKLIEL